MKERKRHHTLIAVGLLLAVTVAALLALPGRKQRGRRGGQTVSYLPAPVTAEAAEVSSWTQAVRRVKEDRGEPVGKQADVETPAELRHYSDTRRFLATQVAEWREHGFRTPKDYVDLAAMIKSGEMVALRPVSKNYILFGVGGQADKGPFTHYENGERIALLGAAELTREQVRLAVSRSNLEGGILALRGELDSVSKTDRQRRAKLQAQIAEQEKALKAEREAEELLDKTYGDAAKRAELVSGYEALESVAKSFPDRDYDLADGRSRQELKVRMLSSLRPEAFKVLEEVAGSYREKFSRPLPITSLVRPDEYQHALSRVNPNATLIETPPHSTGLAFDVNYRYMTAEEQASVMAHLARLKDEGRIEVLRENRDHYHVFAFVDGKRPDEELIRASLGKIGGGSVAKETKRKEEVPAKERKKVVKKVESKRTGRAKGRR
ncbi:MAG TPA: DUF5715 family protein [Pyrinomonadaceae bacterium]|nr:DUF5715 family protein [Pyrinomonadaceae bacterium]